MTIDVSRRSLITGLITLVAAPAIVRVSSIMPVKSIDEISIEKMQYLAYPMVNVVRRAFVPRLYVQLWEGSSLLKGQL